MTRQKHNTVRRIVILGARLDGHAGVVLETVRLLGGYEVCGFIDNTPELQNTLVAGIPVIGSSENLEALPLDADCAHIAIGDNVARSKLLDGLRKRGIPVETIVHPAATVSPSARIGEGCFIGARAVINNGCVVADVCIINTGAIIEHDNRIGLAVHMAPGTKTAGRVVVEDYAFVGLGATILPDIRIGSGALIGAGSTVVKDVTAKTTVIGYAAKKRQRSIYSTTVPDTGAERVYVARPTLPEYDRLDDKFRDIAQSLMLSNFAKYSSELEGVVENMLDVRRALTFPNGTSALMLAMKALDLSGEIIIPSFTFAATGTSAVWAGLTPVFADIEEDTFNIDLEDVARKITPKTSAIVGVHIFGNPCKIDALAALARKHGLKLIFDSAHALGSRYNGRPVGGFGDVECFSLSGTKVITSAEGGVATSNDAAFMDKMHLGRNYGAAADYDCQYVGLNGKMSEFHAVIALESLALLERFIVRRNQLAEFYRKRLSQIPGIRFQHVPSEHLSTYKDFAIVVDPERFGMNRDELIAALNEEGIYPKKYFYPPLHRMTAFANVVHRAEGLERTDRVANAIICLPIFSHMNFDTLEKVCYTIHRAHLAAQGRPSAATVAEAISS